MSNEKYGFRTGRMPLRPHGTPWVPILLLVLAAAAWIWALAPHWDGQAALSQPSIPQTATPVKEEITTPPPQISQTLTTEAASLYAVQLSAHEDEATAQAAREALASQGLAACPYPMENGSWKLLDSLHPNQEAADARKAELAAVGRETYVFTWEIPAFQVELLTTQEELDLWQRGLDLLQEAALSPAWADSPESHFTAQGLSDALRLTAAALATSSDAQLVALGECLASAETALSSEGPMRQRTTQTTLQVSAYIRRVLAEGA